MHSHTTVFLVAGLGLCGFGAWLDREGRRAAAWPTTEGVILVSRAEDAPRLPSDRPWKRQDRNERARVRYSYEVAGKSYQGKGIAMDIGLLPFWEDALARRIAGRYSVGATVNVYYDPDDPALAVLEPGPAIESRLALVAGVLSLGIGVVQALRSRES